MRNPFKRNYYQPMNGKAERFANFLDEIIQANQDCPTIVVDIDDIVKKFKIWEEKMENIHPYYYVGCNRDPFIVKLISLLGRNFTCTTIVSKTEPINLLFFCKKLPFKLFPLLRVCVYIRVKFIKFLTKTMVHQYC